MKIIQPGTQEAYDAIDRFLFQMREMGYNNIQFLASYMDGGFTKCTKRGVGDFYARQGMCQEFINVNVAEDAAQAIANKLDPPDDDWKKEGSNP